jgi:hypothetical protein
VSSSRKPYVTVRPAKLGDEFFDVGINVVDVLDVAVIHLRVVVVVVLDLTLSPGARTS